MILCGLAVGLGACETMRTILGGETEQPLPGERISVLALEQSLEPDPRIADLEVRLPRPFANPAWPQTGGYANHAMQHLALADKIKPVWRADIGAGAASETRLLASPIVADGKVFTMDSEDRITAFGAADGKRLWRVGLTPAGEDRGELGGGLAFDDGVLYVTTGFGDVYALDPASGRFFWRQGVGAPIRGAPTASGGRVFVISSENQLQVLAAKTGEKLWVNAGIEEVADLVGAGSPAVEGNIVVAPYSSGELVALRVENGRQAWSDLLGGTRRITPLGTINDINGSPVIDRGRVFAISYSGRMVAIDLRTGVRIWDQNISGANTPWVAGDFVFVLTIENELIALSQRDGRVRWVRQLPRFEDQEDREGRIIWTGPVLAGDRLILVGSHEKAITVSPYTGEIFGRMDLPDRASLAPVIADGTLYILTDDARLVAYR